MRAARSTSTMARLSPLRNLCVLAVSALLLIGCATVSEPQSYWWDQTGHARGDPELQADLSECNAVRAQAFAESQDRLPIQNVGTSASGAGMMALATANIWRAEAQDAFAACMRRSGWKYGPSQ